MTKKILFFNSNIVYLLKVNNLTHEEFANLIGKKRSIVSAYTSGNTLPRVDILIDIANYFDIPIDDLLNTDLQKTKSKENAIIEKTQNKTKGNKNDIIEKEGNNEGLFVKNEKYKKGHLSNKIKEPHIEHDFRLRTDANQTAQNIPLYNIEATAGLVPLFNETGGHTPVDFINIPNLPKCDGAIYVTGDSMYPLLKSGDIVLYKQINDVINNIFWGEMYLVSIDMEGEEYVTVKYIQKSEKANYIKLVSHNQHHSDKNVHISKVVALAFIKASIRINSMK